MRGEGLVEMFRSFWVFPYCNRESEVERLEPINGAISLFPDSRTRLMIYKQPHKARGIMMRN